MPFKERTKALKSNIPDFGKPKACSHCGKLKPLNQYPWLNEKDKKVKACCKECQKKKDLEYKSKNIERGILNHARRRAKRMGLPFDLKLEDIILPIYCPDLPWIKLKRNSGTLHDDSYSLDRIIPWLGYVKGNIRIISWRANRLKGSWSVYELELIAKNNRVEINRIINEGLLMVA